MILPGVFSKDICYVACVSASVVSHDGVPVFFPLFAFLVFSLKYMMISPRWGRPSRAMICFDGMR